MPSGSEMFRWNLDREWLASILLTLPINADRRVGFGAAVEEPRLLNNRTAVVSPAETITDGLLECV